MYLICSVLRSRSVLAQVSRSRRVRLIRYLPLPGLNGIRTHSPAKRCPAILAGVQVCLLHWQQARVSQHCLPASPVGWSMYTLCGRAGRMLIRWIRTSNVTSALFSPDPGLIFCLNVMTRPSLNQNLLHGDRSRTWFSSCYALRLPQHSDPTQVCLNGCGYGPY